MNRQNLTKPLYVAGRFLRRMLNEGDEVRVLKNGLSWATGKLWTAVGGPRERLVHEKMIRVRVREIRREESGFEIENHRAYLSTRMIVHEKGFPPNEMPVGESNGPRADSSGLLGDSHTSGEPGQRYEDVARLLDSTKNSGYQPAPDGAIEVVIADNGEIKVRGGVSRLSILRVLNPDQVIDVKVVERSRGWLDFKRRVFEAHERRMEAYHPILHPDFSNWRISPYRTDRLKAILDVVGYPKGKRVIDIGAYLGYFSFELARRGADVTGIDNERLWIDLCESINRVYGSGVSFLCDDFVKVLARYQGPRWNYGLFLNVFHWLAIQKGGDVEAVRSAMELLSTKIDNLFFSTGSLEEAGMTSATLSSVFGITDLPTWICHNTEYERFRRLSVDERGRDLLLFTRG